VRALTLLNDGLRILLLHVKKMNCRVTHSSHGIVKHGGEEHA